MEGTSLANHREAPSSYLIDGDMGRHGGGTLTSHSVEPTMEAYENIFGPSARDIKQDLQRFKRHGRWHLPDILKGPNQYLTDRVDGLITDPKNSPFTSRILPYKYITNVDGKIKWNVWSFDEGLASRVPYESAARTLTQSKRSFAGYFVRQGMAIVLEHNFMMTEAGRENFRRQLQQLTGSIQLTNDLDVHMALLLAPSYQKTMNEKYLTQDKSSEQICREFVDLFGFVQKNQNALDILIEEAKSQLRTWGAPMPDFMLCNSKLTFQLTMTPDVTNYVTQGPEGQKKLKTGPNLSSYRGIGIVHTRAFSMETGAPPRDMLRRRVRVAEFYRIVPHKDNHKRLFQLYNEGRDAWSSFTFADLLHKALCDRSSSSGASAGVGHDNNGVLRNALRSMSLGNQAPDRAAAPRLGEAMTAAGNVTGYMSKFLQQLFADQAAKTFTWEPEMFNDTVLFVPGSYDCADWDLAVQQNFTAGSVALLPEFMRNAIAAHESNGGVFTGNQEKRKGKIFIQSLAPYHRNLLASAFLNKITGAGGPGDFRTNVDKPTSFGTATNAAISGHAIATGPGGGAWTLTHRNTYLLYRSMILRNYLRYGVPEAILRPVVPWGTPNVKKIEQVIDFSKDLEVDTDVHFMDQRLRSRGAWFCPNHFKNPGLVFRSFGDYVGYNMLIPKEFAQACVMSVHNPGSTYHEGTFLYDVILNRSRHAALYNAVRLILQGEEAAIRGNSVTRTKLYQDVGLKIKAAMVAQKVPFDDRQVGGVDVIDHMPYWYMPRTQRVQDEVFDNSRPAGWKSDLWALPNFQVDLCITEQIVNDIEATAAFNTAAGDSPKLSVPCPADARFDSDDDVRNFFCAVAWRLWADQETDLTQVYAPATMAWPNAVDLFLFPTQHYGFGHPGQGLMTFDSPDVFTGAGGVSLQEQQASMATESIEVVIVRPNIEHHMLGIILGQGGESLGSTFWGQTELSCYDDSMHGIWGMSYKYHERAIVINERNLIRLWDVAYDGYVGGKDDTAVDWNNDDEDVKRFPNSRISFLQHTTDVTRPYRGPSMMVMAFDHKQARATSASGAESVYKTYFQSNWPSPIVFHDRLDSSQENSARVDFDNLHVVETDQFRVFNNPLYSNAYRAYKDKMPDFWELHKIRKNAGLAASENEVSSDALAFQGTMRVVSADSGAVIQEVLGSGHHGPDFIGVASLRAGKGYRINSQPTVQRLV